MEKANFGQIVSFLFGIANDCLVDTYDVGDYRKIILPMMVIRRFDAVLEPTKEKVLKMKEQLDAAGITDQDEALCSVAGEAFCNSSPYTLSDLKSRTNQQQLKSDFILYLNGFSQNVQDIIKRFEFRNQIDKLSEHDILGLLISKFTDSSVNLSNRPIYDAKGNLVQPALDNHTMGTVFEEVIRKFNEETNITDAGRHFTPRDIVELITDLAFVPVKGKIQSTTYRIYDGACGTGGMLTVAEGRMQEMAKEFGKNVSIHLYGQENSDETYAIARSDMLVKGEGVQANNIFFGSTISNDGFSGETFDFMLSNPPFGTPWKTDLKAWGDIKKDEITDTRFRVNYKGEDFSLIPDIGDPQMLFLANNISKMKKNTVLGSRIVEVHNSSSLSTGKAGSGPSNLRQYIIEQDMLEAIVALPEEIFLKLITLLYLMFQQIIRRRWQRMPSNTKENGFETLIVDTLVNSNGYEQGITTEYNKQYAIDEDRLFRFLMSTQKKAMDELHILDSDLEKDRFFKQLDKKLKSDGVIELLRKGLRYKHLRLDLFYVRPSVHNPEAAALYEKNIFSVTRQLQYSSFNPRLALDVCAFINGLPVITMELKNQLTKQNVFDAVEQYKNDRTPDEVLFSFKRCIVHFAVDDNEIRMCTELKGKKSWFLPFNKGFNNGAGNPPNPNGIKTDYLWKEILTKDELSNIIENYAQVIAEKDEDTGVTKYKQVFPRYHQLSVVKSLLSDAKRDGVGGRYLIQHSAGSGKSNSIAWLAHQLVTLKNDSGKEIFDTVIVVTDRINLDKQIKDTIKQFMQVSATVGWAKSAGELKQLLNEGKKIIITIVHKFQFILDDIGEVHKDKNFAILIDEAHSSQNGSLSAKMNMVLSGSVYDDEDDLEDKINTIIEGRKMVKNASYFAFTATPKNKTLEMFGKKERLPDGTTKPEPHYVYTMKQAIEEGFIMDVLRHFTPVQSYYKLAKTIEDDPKFDKKRAQRLLRYYVESNQYAIHEKANIMVEHFHTEVIAKGKVGGKARAMVITSSIKRAIEYYKAVSKLLEERKSPFKAIVAFSGSVEYEGKHVTEADLNGFPSAKIEKTFKGDPYRILIVANKFQTGFDEPLLHTMYVDKGLADIKAVQTLSRLNRSHPDKKDTFILDFVNEPGVIKEAFDRYYKTTILSGETDVNKLNDLIDTMESIQVYSDADVDTFVERYLADEPRDRLDPILDHCVEVYEGLIIEDQIEFKSCAKTFVRTYNFLSAILPYGSVQWEKLSIFLNLLIPKLPKPEGEDYTEGLLEDVDLESYRAEAQQTMRIQLENENGEIDPIPVSTSVGVDVPELDTLTNILKEFHDIFGNIEWTDEDKIKKQINDIIESVRRDEKYNNAMQFSDKQNARDESDRAAHEAVMNSMQSGLELFREVQNNPSFRKWLFDSAFNSTYQANHNQTSL